MEKRATTVVTSQKATENQTLLVSEPPTDCRHSNTRVEDTVLENPIFPKLGQLYAFPTRLGKCQILDIRWMVCFLQKRKGTVT